MADVKISGLPSDSSLDGNHYVPLNDPTGPTTKRTLLSTLIAWLFDQINIPSGATGSPILRLDESQQDFVVSGLVWTADSINVNRNGSMSSGTVYINGRRLPLSGVVARSFTASRDTYIDVLDNLNGTGSLVYTEVTNGAASPALAANSKRLGRIITNGSAITRVDIIGFDDNMVRFYNTVAIQADVIQNPVAQANTYAWRDGVTDSFTIRTHRPIDIMTINSVQSIRVQYFIRPSVTGGNARLVRSSYNLKYKANFAALDAGVVTLWAVTTNSQVVDEVFLDVDLTAFAAKDVYRLDPSRTGADGADTSTALLEVEKIYIYYNRDYSKSL